MKYSFRSISLAICAWMVFCVVAATTSALPAERHIEMVSPVYKGGFGATFIQGVASEGEAVEFYSPGAFEGAPSGSDQLDYIAHRQASGWSTRPLMPPATLMPDVDAVDVAPSLDSILVMGKPGASVNNPLNEENFLIHPTDLSATGSEWQLGGVLQPIIQAGLLVSYKSASLGFCDALFTTQGNSPLVPEAIGAGAFEELYQVKLGCDGASTPAALVGVNNKDRMIDSGCSTGVGGEGYEPSGNGPSAFNAVSADGGEVFFTVCTSGNSSGANSPHQLFVRLDGSKTLEVSRPLNVSELSGGCIGEVGEEPGEVPCKGATGRPSADFAGASQDGSKVYFTTSAPLALEDKDADNDLYLATIGCPGGKPECDAAEREVGSLTRISDDPNSGQPAEVRGVVKVSPDGSHVYFVAGGKLLSETQQKALEGEGRQVPHLGADNLYVYDSASTQHVSFIGDLCSGSELSGTVEDVSCPSALDTDESLWTKNEGQAQTAGLNGRFLVFSTYAQLSGSDTNVARDVYRYDAETSRLDRVSGGEGGYDGDGNRTVLSETGEVLGAGILPGSERASLQEQYGLNSRAISEDGSRIVFISAEPLSPVASNGLENAYEWREDPGGGEGSVSLISSGSSIEPVSNVVISPNGSSVFFVTVEGLVPQDTDGAPDVYDARIGEGFPQQPSERRPCEGDACQGPLTNPAPLLVPGSVSQAPGGNFAALPPARNVKPKAKPVRCKKGFVKKGSRCVKARKQRRAKRSNRERKASR